MSTTPQNQISENYQQQQQQTAFMKMKINSGLMMSPLHSNNNININDDVGEGEMTKSALSAFRAMEEEIEKKKAEIREKVQVQLGRVEEETKKLAEIREELEGLADPMKKELGLLRKKIDVINRDLKPLSLNCIKKEKEYKEALEAFNEKNREKAQLVGRLMELVNESEKMRMKKLEELNKNIDYLR